MTHIDKKSEAQSALPPVDGLEVVAERLRAYRPLDEWGDTERHSICDEAAEALSQASSVIAGLNKRIEELERARDDAQTANASLSRLIDELDPKFELSRTIARISSLEEENKRLSEALSESLEALQAAEERDSRARFRGNSTRGDAEVVYLRTSAIRAARQALEDHNG